MYCYTYLTNLECGLRELIFAARLSSEHPVFLQKVANCLGIDLAPGIVAGLNRLSRCFGDVVREAGCLLEMAAHHRDDRMYVDPLAQATARVMQQFLQYDQEFITLLQQLMTCGQDQPVWQTLVRHIYDEQVYLYNLIHTLQQQIFQMPCPQPGMQTTPGS
ncbi:MAG: DUF2935 domain-containing protein [Bacillota bacterium]